MNDREKLVELLMDKPYGRGTEKEETEHIEDVADYLIDNGVTVQRWIPVTERLPEMPTKVLVYRPKMAKKIIVSYFGYECFCEGATDIHGNEVITHWMPLPEPPKEDAE